MLYPDCCPITFHLEVPDILTVALSAVEPSQPKYHPTSTGVMLIMAAPVLDLTSVYSFCVCHHMIVPPLVLSVSSVVTCPRDMTTPLRDLDSDSNQLIADRLLCDYVHSDTVNAVEPHAHARRGAS